MKQFVFFIIVLLLVACGNSQDPVVFEVIPAQAVVGETIDIVGERLSGRERYIQNAWDGILVKDKIKGEPPVVTIGGIVAPLVFYDEVGYRLRATVPEGIWGNTFLVVTVDSRPAEPFPFEVLTGL